MIIALTGAVVHQAKDWFVLETSGVGYQVFSTTTIMSSLTIGASRRFWIYEHLREDGHDLFGFETYGELDLFGRLVAISGVGPRTALGVLSLGSIREIERVIEQGDIDILSRVPRVGRKTAQKIVLELKGKLIDLGEADSDRDTLDALVAMGYHRETAREALKNTEGTEEQRLKAALKNLGRKK